jgi:hypothetical protein
MGMTQVNGQNKSFAEEIQAAQEAATAAVSNQQKAEMNVAHLQNELKEKRPQGTANADPTRTLH